MYQSCLKATYCSLWSLWPPCSLTPLGVATDLCSFDVPAAIHMSGAIRLSCIHFWLRLLSDVSVLFSSHSQEPSWVLCLLSLPLEHNFLMVFWTHIITPVWPLSQGFDCFFHYLLQQFKLFNLPQHGTMLSRGFSETSNQQSRWPCYSSMLDESYTG